MSLSVLLNINADWYIFPCATDFTLFLQINQLFYNKKSIFVYLDKTYVTVLCTLLKTM